LVRNSMHIRYTLYRDYDTKLGEAMHHAILQELFDFGGNGLGFGGRGITLYNVSFTIDQEFL
jgi:hypothetical protein